MRSHMHKFKFDCRLANGHDHRLLGYAGGMVGIGSLPFPFLLRRVFLSKPYPLFLRCDRDASKD